MTRYKRLQQMSLDQIVMMFDEAQFNSSAWIWWKIMVQAKLDLIKIVDSKRKILILDFQRQYSCNRKPKTKRKIESQNIRSFLTWFELWPAELTWKSSIIFAQESFKSVIYMMVSSSCFVLFSLPKDLHHFSTTSLRSGASKLNLCLWIFDYITGQALAG